MSLHYAACTNIILQPHAAISIKLMVNALVQGQYSFMIYDGGKKQVFAARDPGGQQPLYYSLESDGSVSFTNRPIDVPGAECVSDWQEVPPGHYVAGKHPGLHQFALTPEQLLARRYYDAMEDDQYPLQPIAIPGKRRMGHSQSLYHGSNYNAETDVFSLSF